jgi:DNA repair protein RadD
MLLRPYQSRLVERAEKALKTHGNTLAIGATGAGKTLMLSDLARRIGGKQLVIQHRQELVDQNMTKFRRMNPKAKVGMFTADVKTWRGDTTFAMVQTLASEKHLAKMPKIDLLVIDEAHHACAPTWKSIIGAVKDVNPGAMIAGFTATPERTDKKGLRGIFSNVCDTVTIRELVQLGFLVPPRGFVIDVQGTQSALQAIQGTSDYFDQAEVERILNTVAINDEVVRNWMERAGDRRTVVFCSTVQHAKDVAEAFRAAGVRSECVHGNMGDEERQGIIKRFDKGMIQVITNVMVLTEGFDSQPVGCVVLLRKCSAKGPLIQMVGRGLRTVNPEEYPGIKKADCIVLDFGTSLLTHGDLEAGNALGDDGEREPGEATTKICPQKQSETENYLVPDSNGAFGCGAEIPCQCKTCPLCGFQFERPGGDDIGVTRVSLTEMDILNASPFRYVDLFRSGRAMIATGFEAWAGVFSADGESWAALGKVKNERRIHRLAETGRVMAMAAADDFLREHETDGSAKKTKGWLDQPATGKQIELLNRFGYQAQVDLLGQSDWTKYSACCHAEFQFNRRMIETALGVLQ